MAKLVSENVLVTLSRVVKDDAKTSSALSDEHIAALEALVTELVGAGFVVEVQSIPDA
jgi:hypothetical protein